MFAIDMSCAAALMFPIVCQAGPDKFMGSGLDEYLKAHGIKTVIVCGTSAQGVGIGTGSGAAQRGYKVIFPVDCVSARVGLGSIQ
jgi:nicotinamidase-related amidase